MFGLFTRPTRRPRNTRRTSVRPVLRVEALEARANPDANPTLSNVTAVWTSATQVVISGTVNDASASTTPTTVLVGGATTAAVTTNPQGNFTVALTVAQPGTLLVAAEPTTAAATPVTVIAAGQPTLSNVTITQGDDGAWHIRGQVTGNNPIGTVITIISSIPSINGETNVVENPDGTFDIGIILPSGTPGGSISITLGDGDGDVFDQWDGAIG